MLEELYRIGKLLLQSKGINVEQFIDKAKLSKTKKVICITLKLSNEKIEYYGIEIEDYSDDWAIRYLYRPGTSNGSDITPSSIITDPKKTFENKILRWITDNKNEDNFLENIYNIFSEIKENIINDIIEKYKSLKEEEKKNTLLTIKFKKDNEDKYLNDFQIFQQILEESSRKRYHNLKSMGESKGVGICYLCGENKEVYGFVLPSFGFSFSTADKKGFVGGFSQENRWKEIPICRDCAMILETGKKFSDQNLSFKFYNSNYYLIPSIILSEKESEILKKFLDRVNENKGKEYHNGLVADEDYLSDYVSRMDSNVLKLIFMFYAKKGGGKYIEILKVVENVLPSQFNRILKTQHKVQSKYNEDFVKKIFGKNSEGEFVKFNFQNFKKNEFDTNYNNWYIRFGQHFFGSNKEFLGYVSKILSNQYIDKQYILSFFVKTIKEKFRNNNDYEFKIRVTESLMIYEFLIELDLIGGENMENNENMIKIGNIEIEKFIEEREKAFPNIQAKASFLVGALVNYLLWIQRDQRKLDFGDEPFRSRLYGLNLDEKKLKKIFKEAVEKLNEYKKYTTLENDAANYLFDAGEGWTLSKDEISYYFSLGLVMGSVYLKEKIER